MKAKLYFVCLLMCFTLVAPAVAAMRELTEPGLGFPDSFPAPARAKVQAVLQRPDCMFVGGTAHVSGTRLRYQSETVPLNLFLESLAKCPGITVSIRFHSGLGDDISDWVVDQSGLDPTRLCVRINVKSSRVRIEDLVVPEIKAPSQDRTDDSKPQTVLSVKEVLANSPELKDRNPPKEIVVKFDVGSIMTVPTSYPDGSKHQVLHLVPNDGNAKFTAWITPEFLEKLKQIGIDDISEHFVGRTVILQGYVSGTRMALVGSPTIWTYHITLNSFENVQVVTASTSGPSSTHP